MIKIYSLILSLLTALTSIAQTTETTQTVKKTTTTTTKTGTKAKPKAKKAAAKTQKSTASGATTPSSSKATTSPTSAPATGTRTSIGQPTTPAATPSQTSGTQAGRGGATTTTTTTDNTTTTPTNTTPTNTTQVTQVDAASALRDALSIGIQSAVSKTSALDGFLGNSDIKIPFPQDAAFVQTALTDLGLGSLTDNVTTSLNRAAENAAVQATPIFLSSIKQLTFTDALNIVSGGQQDAATQFLQRTTTEQLVSAFKPSIKTALDNANATRYWATVMDEYNKIPFVQHIETDLPDYVTRKAISGLFVMVAREEANIRKNPFGQTNPMVKKVFGSVRVK